MNKLKIFIDGQEGTTGLKILSRFDGCDEFELLKIAPELRKDKDERGRLINEADYVFLCLPDDAAREAVSLVKNDHTCIIDASTAHRTNPDWAYGFPELSEAHREKILTSNRIAVPGCYASGFESLVYPLVSAGVLPKDYPVTAFAASGYSGGGKKMIAQYEAEDRGEEFDSPRFYALNMWHKHLPEMQYVTGLDYPPAFTPFVGDYFCGMAVFVPLHTRFLPKGTTVASVRELFSEHYKNAERVSVMSEPEGFIASNTLAERDDMQLFISGNEERILLCSRFDNLGKGASGAAVQVMRLRAGLEN